MAGALARSLAEYAAGLAVLGRAALVMSEPCAAGSPAAPCRRQAMLQQTESARSRLLLERSAAGPAGSRWQRAGVRARR